MLTSSTCLRQLLIVSVILCNATAVGAQMKPGVPYGWKLHGSRADKYECGVDADTLHDGKASAYLRGLSSTIAGDAAVVQYLSPEKFLGQRIKLSGWIKTKDVQDLAGLWMRIGGANNDLIGLDNMENRPAKGTSDWAKLSIVMDVPTDTKEIAFGFSEHGPGTCWISGLSLNIVAKDVPTTNLTKRKQLPEEPVNLDFTTNK